MTAVNNIYGLVVEEPTFMMMPTPIPGTLPQPMPIWIGPETRIFKWQPVDEGVWVRIYQGRTPLGPWTLLSRRQWALGRRGLGRWNDCAISSCRILRQVKRGWE